MTDRDPRLKPCPFCGSVYLLVTSISDFGMDPKKKLNRAVICQDCWAGGPHSVQTVQEARDAWNRRPSDDR